MPLCQKVQQKGGYKRTSLVKILQQILAQKLSYLSVQVKIVLHDDNFKSEFVKS